MKTILKYALVLIAFSAAMLLFFKTSTIFVGDMKDQVQESAKIISNRLDSIQNRSSQTEIEHTISMEDYKKMQTGMSYRQVVAILHAEGEETGSNKTDAVPGATESIETVMYSWKTLDGVVMVMFQNDKLFQKNQAGLK